MSAENLQILLNFLHHTKSTAVFEQLQPSYQHVVDLSYLSDGKSALKFITWTSAFKNESSDIESYCSIRPDKVCFGSFVYCTFAILTYSWLQTAPNLVLSKLLTKNRIKVECSWAFTKCE